MGIEYKNDSLCLDKLDIGVQYEIIQDPEGRSEITTDSEGKIISYKDSDGVKHEEVGIETNHFVLSKDGIIEFQQALKDAGVIIKNPCDYTDSSEIQIEMPDVAIMNITGVSNMPRSKVDDLHAYAEVWDKKGNYFKKKIILNAQGNSSLGYPKKNFAVDWCEDDWIGDETTKIKIGKWVSQDSHHFKAYYSDFFNGAAVVAYQWFDELIKTRGIYDDRNWKRELIPSVNSSDISFSDDYSLLYDSGARCFPDGFPCIVYLNGDFYGIFCWQLKKHRDNYHQIKDEPKNIHIDGNLSNDLIWYADGNIDWKKWAGIIQESPSSLNKDGVEIRNPKDLILRNGEKYDFDEIHALPEDTDIINVELVGEDNSEYDILMAEAEQISDEKKRKKKRIKALKYTAKTKEYLINLTNIRKNISDAAADGSTAEEIKELISTYFDVKSLIDYQIFSDITGNRDGTKKIGNGQHGMERDGLLIHMIWTGVLVCTEQLEVKLHIGSH